MARIAVIDGTTVVDVILADLDYQIDGLMLVESASAGPGWTFHPGINTFSPPEPYVPTPQDYPLRPDQFYAMLDIAGLTAGVEQAVEAIPDETERKVARAKLKYTPIFYRDHPLFAMVGPALGLSDEQIDAMWMQAKDI